ncbi:MAG: tRNA pseudouridine(38-40) synthase TruA [Candidatus Heimdallarchaeota archaeon]|nr:tRNA pseudouridine(38-40) synthase TruA [Candidatus Heimdallarchaeota archaeon]
MTQRYAVKIAYLGKNYQGFQRQENSIRTIEGEIATTLTDLGIIKDFSSARYSAAGRTDRGVHALSQVISFDSLRDTIYLEEINQKLPEDMYAWGIVKVDNDFHARRSATKRTYRYYLNYSNERLVLMRKALKKLIGTHDFIKLCKKPDDLSNGRPKSTTLTLLTAKVRLIRKNSLLEFEFSSQSFLWHQVRKMVSLVLAIGKKELPIKAIEQVLDPTGERLKKNIILAPAEGLILYEIEYPGIKFEPLIRKMIIEKKFLRELQSYSSTFAVMQLMKRFLF